MKSVKEHLQQMHTANAEAFSKMADCMNKMHSCMKAMGDIVPKEHMGVYEHMTASAEQLATHFVDAGNYAVSCAKDLSESSYKTSMDQLEPLGRTFSYVDAPAASRGVAVPRHGAPPITGETDIEAIPHNFRKLVSSMQEEI